MAEHGLSFLVEADGKQILFDTGSSSYVWKNAEKLGVSPVGEAGEEFNPELHNAVAHVEDESIAENTIVEVFQKGYMLKEKVIRHAMVKVAN